MRYLGTSFNVTICGLRLRVRVDLDDVDDAAPAERKRRVRLVAGAPPHHARVMRG